MTSIAITLPRGPTGVRVAAKQRVGGLVAQDRDPDQDAEGDVADPVERPKRNVSWSNPGSSQKMISDR